MSTEKSHTVDLIKDGDDLILPFPEGMCEELGWEVGDTLEFIDNKDGTWTMRKKEVDNASTV